MRRTTLRKQVLALFLVSGLLPLLVLSAAAFGTLEEAVVQSARNEERGRAIHAAAAVSTEINHEAMLLEQLASRASTREALASKDAGRLEASATDTLAEARHLRGLLFMDAEGRTLTEVGETSGLAQSARESASRAANQGETAAALGPDPERFTLVAHVEEGGRAVGFVAASHDASSLRSLLNPERGGGIGALVDGEGNVILAAGDAERREHHEALARFAAAEAVHHPNGAGRVDDLAGGAAVAGYSRLEGMEGAVVVAQPLSTVVGPLRPLEWGFAGILVLVASGAGLAALAMTARLSRPIARLAETASALAGGNLKARAVPAGSAETASFAEAFNAMAAEIERQDALIRAHAEEMEQEVDFRYRELVDRNEELEGFNFAVAHELREPLRSMETLTRFVLDDYGGRLDPDAKRHLEMVHESSGALQRLIFDLMHLDEVTRGTARVEEVDLAAVAEEVKARLAPYAETRRGAIQVVGAFPTVQGDRARLTEALHHLVENGLKFNEEEHPRVTVRAREEPEHVALLVEDNGIGIPADRTTEIFAPFKKLHRKEAYPGSGVGLTLVRKVAERHGGNAEVAPREDGGSVFTLRISRAGLVPLRVGRDDVEPPRMV